jgi:ribosomal protein L5
VGEDMSTFKKLYNEQITNSLMEKFNYSSKMEIPKLEKIVINMGVGEGAADSKFIEAAVKAGDKELAVKLLTVAYSKIDKSVSRGIQHRNTAARQKSRLSALIASL